MKDRSPRPPAIGWRSRTRIPDASVIASVELPASRTNVMLAMEKWQRDRCRPERVTSSQELSLRLRPPQPQKLGCPAPRLPPGKSLLDVLRVIRLRLQRRHRVRGATLGIRHRQVHHQLGIHLLQVRGLSCGRVGAYRCRGADAGQGIIGAGRSEISPCRLSSFHHGRVSVT